MYHLAIKNLVSSSCAPDTNFEFVYMDLGTTCQLGVIATGAFTNSIIAVRADIKIIYCNVFVLPYINERYGYCFVCTMKLPVSAFLTRHWIIVSRDHLVVRYLVVVAHNMSRHEEI